MKSATLVTTLTSLTTAMAVAAPFVVFGFLYVLLVQPDADRSAERLEMSWTSPLRIWIVSVRSTRTPSDNVAIGGRR